MAIAIAMSSFAEGVYTLKIENVSKLIAQGSVNQELYKLNSFERAYYVKYGPFILGINKWELRAVPLGDHLQIHLWLLEEAHAPVVGKIKSIGSIVLLQLQDLKGRTAKWTIQSQDETLRFSTVNFLASLIYSELKNYCKDDCLFLKIILWYPADKSKQPGNLLLPPGPPQPKKPEPTANPAPKNPTKPHCPPPEYITTLLAGDFADIQFTVKGESFAAHRAILAARSSVFRSELLALQNRDDNCSNCKLWLSIQSIDALTFKYLLHYIYTDSLHPDFEKNAPLERYQLLFIAAYRFNVPGLKSICQDKLTKPVTDSLETALKLVEQQECGLLKIVPKDCNIKPETSTSTTSVPKIGDQLYGTSITK